MSKKEVTRHPNGVTNVDKRNPLAFFPCPDPSLVYGIFNDFTKPTDYDVNDWTITTVELGAGAATEAINNTYGGELLITNDAADNDSDSLQLAKETFKFVSGKQLWFKARVKLSDVVQSDFLCGLVITDTDPLTANTDGVYFQKDDGDALLDFYVNKASTASSALAIATLVNATYVEIAFYYDGKSEVAYFVDGVKKGSLALTNLPNVEDLTVTFHIQNGEAAAKTLTIDYFLVYAER